MARYSYQCPECKTKFVVEHPMSVHPKVTCPSCGHLAERVFDPSGIVFKGSGFYNTDQKKQKITVRHTCTAQYVCVVRCTCAAQYA